MHRQLNKLPKYFSCFLLKKVFPILLGALFLFPSYATANDAFVTASIGEPSVLIPFLATDSASASLTKIIFNGLLKYDPDLKLKGDLAESYEVLDGGLRLVFHLRKDVKWHDGKPFTSADVEFTFKKLTDPEVPTPYGGDFERVEKLNVIDDHTVEVIYKEAFSPGLASWTMGIVPKHLLEKEDLMKTEFARNPVGTGPYRLKKWKTAQVVELTANPDYYEGKPGIDKFFYRIIPDQAVTFFELQTEALDEIGLTPLQYAKQTDTTFFKEKYQKYRYPGFVYNYLAYNMNNSLFADRRIRNAIGLAIKKQEIIDVVLMGVGSICTGPFLPTSWAYNHDVKSEYSPEKAKQLLADAGWRDTDGDGFLDKDGKRFSFTVLTNQGNDQRKQTCEVIQKNLSDIGIDMKIQIVEWSTFIKEFVDKKKFDALLLGWNTTPEPDIFDIFHSSKIGNGQFNFIEYKNPEVDRLLEEARRLFDESERKKIYHKVHEIIHDEEPYTFLFFTDALPILHKRFKGVSQTALGIHYDFIRWSVPDKETLYA